MKCKICNSESVTVDYEGIIRDGWLGNYTLNPVKMYRCCKCDTIWHDVILDTSSYYETDEYRNKMEGTINENDFYRLHDKDNLDKLMYTGTTIFRNCTVADIGCGAGAFLDFVSGAAKEIIAIEPTQAYHSVMKRKGYHTFSYAKDAFIDYAGKIDVITSFDVIEHVNSPQEFISDVYKLLSHGGTAVIGTPTEAPFMRRLLGKDYEKKVLFSTQHLWVLGEKNLRLISNNAGFKDEEISFRYFQRYGIGNVFGWLKEKEPGHNIKDTIINNTIDMAWRGELESEGQSDYIVLYLNKS